VLTGKSRTIQKYASSGKQFLLLEILMSFGKFPMDEKGGLEITPPLWVSYATLAGAWWR
jgi:hypothetical protein